MSGTDSRMTWLRLDPGWKRSGSTGLEVGVVEWAASFQVPAGKALETGEGLTMDQQWSSCRGRSEEGLWRRRDPSEVGVFSEGGTAWGEIGPLCSCGDGWRSGLLLLSALLSSFLQIHCKVFFKVRFTYIAVSPPLELASLSIKYHLVNSVAYLPLRVILLVSQASCLLGSSNKLKRNAMSHLGSGK